MQLQDLTWPALDALSRDTPVVIPIAAIEQHGHHLPLSTDSTLLTEIVARAEKGLNETALLTPLLWLGNSHHHLDFCGTLSAAPRTYLDLVSGLLDNMLHHGFRRILVLNGHGGNDVPGKQSTFEIRQRYRSRDDLLLLFSTYWQLAEPTERITELHQQEMGHACEWETSMMLAINPSLVGNYQTAEPNDTGTGFSPANRAWQTAERTSVGHIGWPNLASREKGEALLGLFSNGVIEMVRRMAKWDGQSWDG